MAKKKKIPKKKKRAGKKIDLPLKKILANRMFLGVVVCAGLLAAIIAGLGYFFRNSPIFTVKEIVINKERGYPFHAGERRLTDLYLGSNMFRIDLSEIKLLIREDYPHLKKIEVRRVLPDRIEVDIVLRRAVAYIHAGYDMIIDKEGIILGKGEDVQDLVQIRGIRFFFAPATGEQVKDKRLASALVLLDGLRKNMPDFYHDFRYIDISDKRNLVVGLNGLIVKMGASGLTRRIRKLEEILRDTNIDLKDIEYIDLRFEDAIISPR